MGMLKDTAQTTENSTALGKPEDVHTKEDQVATGHIEVGHNEDCLDKLQATDLASSQEIPARNIHPMKLVMLLRLKFGIGRYEISRIPNVYKIQTPRPLSAEEIAECGW